MPFQLDRGGYSVAVEQRRDDREMLLTHTTDVGPVERATLVDEPAELIEPRQRLTDEPVVRHRRDGLVEMRVDLVQLDLAEAA